MANVRYRSTYYNTTGTGVTWTLEILDTESVAQVINFQSTVPNDSFEGLTADLKPGVYPASLKFGMYLRSTPKVIQGVTYGPTIGILTDIATSAEGRFLARLQYNGVVHFVGPIIWDQSSYTDEDIPLLQVTAVDGMNRWQTTDYVSEVGQLVYYSTSLTDNIYDTVPLTYDGPIIGGAFTLIEYTADGEDLTNAGATCRKIATFVHREIYSINSPGAGWVSQGQGKWAKAVPYTNEQFVEIITNPNTKRYHFTRDIDDEKHRNVSEIFYKAMVETNMAGEYISPAVMYDVGFEWREHSMPPTGDPTGLMRVHEEPFIGGTIHDAVMYCCRQFNMRVYYSKGRYHFEQISLRDDPTFTRYTYQSDGTYIGTETASLDLNFASLDIEPGTGGLYKFLAPFRSVEAKITLDSANFLDGVNWKDGQFGTRYLGRITKGSGVQKMFVTINAIITSTFDPAKLALYPQSFLNTVCPHRVAVIYSIRINNINTATTYWLEQGTTALTTTGTWEITEKEITPFAHPLGGPARRFTAIDYGQTINRRHQILAETLPGSADDMFDVHISFRTVISFDSAAGATFWLDINTGKFWNVANTSDNLMKFYSVADYADWTNWEESEVNRELVYVAENDVDNSIKVKTELQWADTTQHNKSIEIYNGTDWQKSTEWSINGTGTPVAILELLVNEIMSLRTLPRKLYSGSFLSTLPNAESRFQRGTSFYLPLSCSKDTDVDTFSGEFLEIARTTPPAVEVIGSPIAGEPLPGIGGFDNPDPPIVALYFETNEIITAASTLTEVDIINTLLVYVPAGETVSIVDQTNGNTENVTLTADINPSDTVMYFESNTFTNGYPDGSLIVLQDGGVTIGSGGAKYRYDNRLYNGSTHTVPVAVLALTALNGLSNQHLNNKVWVWRNGQKLIGIDYTTIGLVGGIYWWYDSGTNQINVHADFEYVDEYLGIDIDLNR